MRRDRASRAGLPLCVLPWGEGGVSMTEKEGVNVDVTACPECWTLLVLERPHQAETFPCPLCRAGLRVKGMFVEGLAYGASSRLHHLT